MKTHTRVVECTCKCRCFSLQRRGSSSSSTKSPFFPADTYNAFTSGALDSTVPGSPSSSNGPLKSLRISFKDNFAVQGAPTTCASRMLKSYESPFDASVVSLARQNGAEIVGKTNMDEFGMGSHGLYSYFGKVENPLDTARVVGGSSSGAAASVAAGLCDAFVEICHVYALRSSY